MSGAVSPAAVLGLGPPPSMPAPVPPWVVRAGGAHNNGVENLAIFAPAVLCALSAGDHITVPCFIYLIAR